MSWVKYFFRMLFGLQEPVEPEPEEYETVEQILDDLRTDWARGE
jgi:hypothetical protein